MKVFNSNNKISKFTGQFSYKCVFGKKWTDENKLIFNFVILKLYPEIFNKK